MNNMNENPESEMRANAVPETAEMRTRPDAQNTHRPCAEFAESVNQIARIRRDDEDAEFFDEALAIALRPVDI